VLSKKGLLWGLNMFSSRCYSHDTDKVLVSLSEVYVLHYAGKHVVKVFYVVQQNKFRREI
jgi:hypothetical protein